MKQPAEKFVRYVREEAAQLRLDRAALLVAHVFQSDLDVDYYLHRLDAMAEEIYSRLLPGAGPDQIHEELLEYLYLDCGYGGNVQNYYDARNSYLNEVIERRLGIPISLSLLHLEVARRLGLTAWGVGMPMHFLVGGPYRGETVYWDPFFSGARLGAEDCARRLASLSQGRIRFDPSFLSPLPPAGVLARLLSNLKLIFIQRGQGQNALTVVEMLLPIASQPAMEIRDRGLIWLRLGDLERARTDLEHYLAAHPDADDAESVRLRLARLGRPSSPS